MVQLSLRSRELVEVCPLALVSPPPPVCVRLLGMRVEMGREKVLTGLALICMRAASREESDWNAVKDAK